MNLAKYKISLENSIKTLRKLGLFASENYSQKNLFDLSKFTDEFYRLSTKDDYFAIYDLAIQDGIYDFILIDDSFFQFSFQIIGNSISYRFAFYQNPKSYPTYKEFLNEEFGDDCDEDDVTFLEYYDQLKCEAHINSGATVIRYDYDESLYDKDYHPVSHLHIGHNNSLRIGCDKIITPELFVVFVVKNIYYKQWKETCVADPSNIDLFKDCKCLCDKIDPKYFNCTETIHLVLT